MQALKGDVFYLLNREPSVPRFLATIDSVGFNGPNSDKFGNLLTDIIGRASHNMAESAAFNGWNALTGWETYASRNQDDRTTAPLARQGMTPPKHLSCALYIPRHDGSASQITLYDISAQYTAAIGGLSIGSSDYLVALELMQKPGSNGSNGASVAYDVTFRGQGQGVVGLIRCQGSTAQEPAEVELYVQYNASPWLMEYHLRLT